MSDEVYRYDTFEVRDGVTMRQMVTTTAPAGAEVVLAADYDRLRELLHNQAAETAKAARDYAAEVSALRERAEKAERERDDLIGRLFRYEHTDQGDGLRYVAEGYHKRIVNDLRQHADRLAEELTWGLDHSASLDDEAEAHSERGYEALAAYRDAYPVPDTTT